MPHHFSDQEKQRQLEHDVIESGFRIYKHSSPPQPKEFPHLTDKEALIGLAVSDLHWTHKRIGEVFGLSRRRTSQVIQQIKHKLTQI